MSASRVGFKRRPERRALISLFQSGMFDPGDAADGFDELAPGVALRGEDFAPVGGQPVVAPAALAVALDPAPLNPPAPLKAVEQRVERGDVEAEEPARALLDEAADVVAVTRLI